jgi:hypothetical protein
MKTILSSVLLVPLIACSDNSNGDDSGGSTDDTATAGAVWQRYADATPEIFTGVFAGNQVYLTATGGSVRVFNGSSAKTQFTRFDSSSSPTFANYVGDTDLWGIWGQTQGADTTLVVVGDNGVILVYAAQNWTAVQPRLGTANLDAISGPSVANLMAGGWGGVFRNTAGDPNPPVFGWDSEQAEVLPGNPRVNHLWYDGAFAMAVGDDGARLKYGGAKWVADNDANLVDIYGVHGLSPTDVWAVGADATTFHYDGSTWTAHPVDVVGSLWAVYMIATDSVYAVGQNGLAIHWDGTAWARLPTGGDHNLYALHGNVRAIEGDENIYACGASGALYQYTGYPDEDRVPFETDKGEEAK